MIKRTTKILDGFIANHPKSPTKGKLSDGRYVTVHTSLHRTRMSMKWRRLARLLIHIKAGKHYT